MILKITFVKLVILSLLLMNSCTSSDEKVIAIDFSEEVSDEAFTAGEDSIPVLRVAVATVISPKESFVYYDELFDFMSDRLNMKVEFKQLMSYTEVNSLLEKNLVDMAFICSGAYVDGSDSFDLLVAPLSDSQPYYHAYVIAHEDSGIERFEDIQGHTFAFTDPLSFTGKTYAMKRVSENYADPGDFFESIIYTMSHDVSIQMVSRNLVDAASVNSLIFDYLKTYQPEKVDNVRIIETSEHFGIPPVVSSLLMPVEIRDRLQELFIEMHEDERGKKILENLLIDRFITVEDSLYNNVRKFRSSLWQ